MDLLTSAVVTQEKRHPVFAVQLNSPRLVPSHLVSAPIPDDSSRARRPRPRAEHGQGRLAHMHAAAAAAAAATASRQAVRWRKVTGTHAKRERTARRGNRSARR